MTLKKMTPKAIGIRDAVIAGTSALVSVVVVAILLRRK